MKELKFQNPTFNDGENVTIRRGDKWNNIKEALINGKSVNLKTELIRFNELTDLHIKNEHDPKCRSIEGLFEVMSELYYGFNKDEYVTIIYFIWKN